MQFCKSYKGFEIFQENETKNFVLCVDTPDGMIRCNQPFTELEQATSYIDERGQS
jgi:hypothetical protein